MIVETNGTTSVLGAQSLIGTKTLIALGVIGAVCVIGYVLWRQGTEKKPIGAKPIRDEHDDVPERTETYTDIGSANRKLIDDLMREKNFEDLKLYLQNPNNEKYWADEVRQFLRKHGQM